MLHIIIKINIFFGYDKFVDNTHYLKSNILINQILSHKELKLKLGCEIKREYIITLLT